MDGPFKLLVYALAAVAILAVFFAVIQPFFFRTTDPIDLLTKNLAVAETSRGTGITENATFPEIVMTGATFDSDNRSVAFECNDGVLCCDIGQRDENCTNKVAWSERYVEVKERIDIETTTRCTYENTIFVCKIYLGKKPAQVEVKKAEIQKEINLAEGPAKLKLEIKNSGRVSMLSGEIKAELYERYLEGTQWKRRYIGKGLVEESFDKLDAGEKLEKTIEINAGYPGKYEIDLFIKGENGGYEKQTLEFEATGSRGCSATQCTQPWTEFGKCKTNCSCESCLLSSQCEEQVTTNISSIMVGSETVDVDLKLAVTSGLGTNLVEVFLDESLCPIDLAVTDLNNADAIISFNIVNLRKTATKSDFSIQIFKDYGQGSQRELFNENIDADNINDSERKIEKKIALDLDFGTHSITVIVNADKKLVETNYENNKAEITINLPPPKPEPPKKPPTETLPGLMPPSTLIKKVVNPDGGSAVECRFIIDDSGSMTSYLDLANSLVTRLGKEATKRNRSFIYTIGTINSNGWDERWGDVLNAVRGSFKWSPDAIKKCIVLIGDGESEGNTFDPNNEAALLHADGVVVHSMRVGLVPMGPYLQSMAVSGGGQYRDLTDYTVDVGNVINDYAQIIMN